MDGENEYGQIPETAETSRRQVFFGYVFCHSRACVPVVSTCYNIEECFLFQCNTTQNCIQVANKKWRPRVRTYINNVCYDSDWVKHFIYFKLKNSTNTRSSTCAFSKLVSFFKIQPWIFVSLSKRLSPHYTRAAFQIAKTLFTWMDFDALRPGHISTHFRHIMYEVILQYAKGSTIKNPFQYFAEKNNLHYTPWTTSIIFRDQLFPKSNTELRL